MFQSAPHAEVYLHREPVDFRKQIDGLAVIVQTSMELSPMREALFVFTNRRADRIKVLWWDGTGFCLWLKRLELVQLQRTPRIGHGERAGGA